MKKIAFILIMGVTTSVFAEDWKRIGSSDGTTLYVDMAEVKKATSTVRVLFDYREPQTIYKGGPYLSLIARGIVDCISGATKATNMTLYSKSMAGGDLRQLGASDNIERALGILNPILIELNCSRTKSNNSSFEKNQATPSEVERKIRQIYAQKYPTDFSMQKTLLENQLNSYHHMQRWASEYQVPQKIFAYLKNEYARKYPDDYSMQKTLVENQCNSYRFIQSFNSYPNVPSTVFNNLKQQYAQKYPFDFSMQKTLLEDQVKSYLALRR